MEQTFGIVDNGVVRKMTPEEVEYYSSLREENESIEDHQKRISKPNATQ